MTVTGKITVIQDTETFTSGFTKRVAVIMTAEKYPQEIPVEFFKDKTTLLDSFSLGDQVSVDINLRGSGEYNGKYYVSLNAWKISKDEGSPLPNPPNPNSPSSQDDLPF